MKSLKRRRKLYEEKVDYFILNLIDCSLILTQINSVQLLNNNFLISFGLTTAPKLTMKYFRLATNLQCSKIFTNSKFLKCNTNRAKKLIKIVWIYCNMKTLWATKYCQKHIMTHRSCCLKKWLKIIYDKSRLQKKSL